MKRAGILHRELGGCISGIGHYDRLALVSCLYGIPRDAPVIDLALTRGIPRMLDVLKVLHGEMIIEKVTIADAMARHHEELYRYVTEELAAPVVQLVPNAKLKEEAAHAKVYIRTGEHVVFSNMILQAGFCSE